MTPTVEEWPTKSTNTVASPSSLVASPSSLVEKKLNEEGRCTDRAIVIARNTVTNQNDKSATRMLDFKRQIVTFITN